MKGRPLSGAISGLIFGLGVGLCLAMFKVLTLGTVGVVVLPAAGLLLGFLLGVAAPLGGRKAGPPNTTMPPSPEA